MAARGKVPNIAVPGLNRGAGIPDGYMLGRLPGAGHGAVQLISPQQLTGKFKLVRQPQLQTILPAIPDGDVLANKSGATAQPTGNTLSAMLDYVFGSTQGDILYRDASAWKVLAPGSAGQFLETGGAAANPTWGVPSGTGRNTEAAWTLPKVADFGTTVNIVRSSVTDGTNALLVDFPGANANNELYCKSAPGTPYDLNIRFKHHIDVSTQQSQAGLVLRNSSSGKIIIFGMISDTNSNVLAQNWNSATSFNSTIFNEAMWPSGPQTWFNIHNDGTTLSFQLSEDGWNWKNAGATTTLANFITSVDQVGFYVFAGAGNTYCRMVINSFGTSLPAP